MPLSAADHDLWIWAQSRALTSGAPTCTRCGRPTRPAHAAAHCPSCGWVDLDAEPPAGAHSTPIVLKLQTPAKAAA